MISNYGKNKHMEDLIKKLEEILETNNIDLSKKFDEYEVWDSLTSLSIIAMLDSDYNITATNKQLTDFLNIEEFCKFVLNNN